MPASKPKTHYAPAAFAPYCGKGVTTKKTKVTSKWRRKPVTRQQVQVTQKVVTSPDPSKATCSKCITKMKAAGVL